MIISKEEITFFVLDSIYFIHLHFYVNTGVYLCTRVYLSGLFQLPQ